MVHVYWMVYAEMSSKKRQLFSPFSVFSLSAIFVRLYFWSDILSQYFEQESHAVAGKPRDAAVNSDRYRVRWHFAGAISVSRMQSVSGCTVYA